MKRFNDKVLPWLVLVAVCAAMIWILVSTGKAAEAAPTPPYQERVTDLRDSNSTSKVFPSDQVFERGQFYPMSNLKRLTYGQKLEKKWAHVYRPNRPYKWSEWQTLMRYSGWPRYHWNKVYRVATCESGRKWKPSNGKYVGLMQHLPGNGGMNRRQLENPVINLIVARWMYEDRGWQPWPVCRWK